MKMAGMSQVLTHRDQSHADDALGRLNKLRRDGGILCDLTIVVEGREFKAHKAVMAACSDYFLNAICGGKTTATVTSGDHGFVTVDLEHVTLRGFVPLLDYAYTSSLQVNASDVIDVLSAASYMQMFKVADACSEFMRSNIMWAQSLPRLASLPGMNHALLNGAKHASGGSLSPAVPGRSAGLPPDVSSILKATSAMTAAGRLGQPPLLIPMHSMAYDVGLHQLAASMAGTQGLLSRAAGCPQQALVASAISSSMSSSPRNATQSPSSAWPSVSAALGSSSHPQDTKESPPPTMNGYPTKDGDNYQPRSTLSHVNGSSGRKSLAVKIESRSEDEDSREISNGLENTKEHVKSDSPNGSAGSEPEEDSWQALQKLYSIRKTEVQRQHPYLPRPDRMDEREGSHSPMESREMSEGSPIGGDGSPMQSRFNSNLNNNNNASKANQIAEFISKLTPKANDLAMDKRSPEFIPLTMGANSPRNVNPATAVAVHNAIMQQQQMLASQHNGTDPSKIVDLPVMPSTGQYMSVRRRTLQSTVPKPHQCQICGSRFTRFHNLKQHIKLHSGIKPYECDECGKRFTRNYTLRLHKMKHVGIRNFRCGTCDASFTSLGEFRAHLRITMHSHVSGSIPMDCGSPGTGNSEPEDLSSPMSMSAAHTSSVNTLTSKYPGYEQAILGYQRGMQGSDRASMFSAALSGAMMARDAGSIGGSSGGAESPQLSDRSVSPEDLSTKATSIRSPIYDEKLQREFRENDNSNEEEYSHDPPGYGESSSPATDRDIGNNGDGSAHGSSPAQYRTESPSSERDAVELDEATTSGGIHDRDTDQDEMADDVNNNTSSTGNGNTKGSNKDQPISLVVNASA